MNAPSSAQHLMPAIALRDVPQALIDTLKSHFGDRCSTAMAVREQHGRDESAYTTVPPQQRYNDYVFSMDDLLDPGANPDTQLRRPLLPEDASAPSYSGKTFGVDLVFLVENQPRTYSFRVQIQSVIPR